MSRRGALRVATVNLQHATPSGGGTASARSLAEAGQALRALDLDVVALQEADTGQRRSGYVHQTQLLARILGATWWRFVPAEVGPRGAALGVPLAGLLGRAAPRLAEAVASLPWDPAYGVGLISRLPVVRSGSLSHPGRIRVLPLGHRLAGGPVRRVGRWVVRRDEARAAVLATVAAPFGRVTIAATHAATDPRAAVVQIGRLAERLAELAGHDGARLLVGDLNLPPAAVQAAVDRVGGRPLAPLAVGATFPAAAPRSQIDHVLGSAGLTGTGETVRLPIADHLALVAAIDEIAPDDDRAGYAGTVRP